MDSIEAVSKRILIRVLTVMFLVCLAIDAACYLLLQAASLTTERLAQTNPSLTDVTGLAMEVRTLQHGFWPYFVPASVVFFLLAGLLLWFLLRLAVARHGQERPMTQKVAQRPPSPEKAKDAAGDKRIFIHLLAVLQREGRLMDFLGENLSQYQDAQIGAAVRTVHETCRKTIQKYLDPQAVLAQQEGDAITLEADFDPHAVKLIGNVTGPPPFTGTVRHRGWRAGKLELPTLAGQQDPAIIAPAEVEVGEVG